MPNQKTKKLKGFTLIEIVIALGIAALSAVTIAKLFTTYLQIVADEKFKVTAIALANQKIETIRNLPYSNIGTVGGIPPGQVIQDEEIVSNNIHYTVKTEVIYIDDPFDGLNITAGTDNSIYNDTHSNLSYYWSMESNSSGQSPDVGSGTLTITNVTSETGYNSNGLGFDESNSPKIVTSVTNNIDANKGRIAFWFQATNDYDGYFFDVDTSSGDFRLREQNGNRLRFDYGDGNARSAPLTWNDGQWYFIEAAWDGAVNYREIWRDGIPLNMRNTAITPPVFATDWHIGHRQDNSNYMNGVLDEMYVMDDPFQFQIWGYNESNPYFESNPKVTFYWNMDDSSSSQTPQVGSGSITVGDDYEAVSPAVVNNGLEFGDNNDRDYASVQTAGNIDFSDGRIGFWYRPDRNNPYAWNSPHLLNAYNCTNGSFSLDRLSDNKLSFTYGSISNNNTIESQAISFNRNWWYFIEVAFDSANDYVGLFVNRQEVASDSITNIDTPIGCPTMYIGNENSNSLYHGEGDFDEIYFLDDVTPDGDLTDTLNTDYKRVKVTVEYNSPRGIKKIYAITDIAPPGIETTAGGGTLYLHVYNSNGLPVSGADVNIYNDSLDPIIDMDSVTDTDGNLIVPGAPIATSSYEITVTKTGYSTDKSYAATTTYPNPVREHLTVIEGETTEASFAIDLTSTLTINTVSQSLPVNWQINTDGTDTGQINPAVAYDSSYFYFPWEDYRDEATYEIYTQKYNTSGISQWASDQLVSNGQNQYGPRIVTDGSGNQYITWYDDSSGDNDIYLQKYNSSGVAQWTTKTVNTTSAGSEQIKPDLILSPVALIDVICVAWEDNRNDTGDIYANCFDNSGNKLSPVDIQLNTDSSGNTQSDPKFVNYGASIAYVGWLDDRNGSQDIYVRALNATLAPVFANEAKINSNSATNITRFDLTVDSNLDAYALWNDNRNGNFDLFMQRMASTSALIYGSDTQITTQAASANQQNPYLATDSNDDLYFGWNDDRGTDNDIYILKADNTGSALWAQEMTLNLETAGDQYLTDLITYDTSKVIATWTDYGQDDDNAWAGTLNYDGSETAVPFVDFDLTGSKLIYSLPDLEKYDQSLQTDATGQLILTDMEWDTYDITVTDALYSLQQTEPIVPYLLEAGTSTVIKIIVN